MATARQRLVVLTHTGTAYSSLGEQRKAVEYLERALQLRVAVSDRQGEAITLNQFRTRLRLVGGAAEGVGVL